MVKSEEVAALGRGEGCLGRSQDDEPVFVLVARDKFSADTIRWWAKQVVLKGQRSQVDPKILEALALADQMDEWREAHGGGKVPD